MYIFLLEIASQILVRFEISKAINESMSQQTTVDNAHQQKNPLERHHIMLSPGHTLISNKSINSIIQIFFIFNFSKLYLSVYSKYLKLFSDGSYFLILY